MRRTPALLVLLFLPVLLAACGERDDAAADDASAVAAEHVTVEHKYGSTTIEEPPSRIVSLATQWTDVLLALDAPLVGYAADTMVEGGQFPWQQGLLADAEALDGATIPYEAIAELDPDLIVVTYLVADEAEYERLSQIAPTIPLLTGTGQVDPWEDMAEVAGRVLDDVEGAETLVDEADARSAALLKDLPALEGKTYALANYVPGDALYVVADPDDGASVLFGQIGLSIDPEILEHADDVSGRVTLSLEQISLLGADVLVLFTNGADASEVPGYSALPAVQSGAVAVLDYAAVVGLNTPTPLSVPYSLDLIHPALEAAAT